MKQITEEKGNEFANLKNRTPRPQIRNNNFLLRNT